MKRFKIKDPGSSITHFIGFMLALIFSYPLLAKSAPSGVRDIFSMSVFLIGLLLLYAASTTYHTFNLSNRANQILKKADHMMICVLIAATYTPICLLPMRGNTGNILLLIIWLFALTGILIKAFWVNCPKWVSSVLYIAMGWTCLIAFPKLMQCLPSAAFWWLLTGGILYTIGGVIYALKLSVFNNKHKYFGSHEIFHLFVMAGSICHYMVMWNLL